MPHLSGVPASATSLAPLWRPSLVPLGTPRHLLAGSLHHLCVPGTITSHYHLHYWLGQGSRSLWPSLLCTTVAAKRPPALPACPPPPCSPPTSHAAILHPKCMYAAPPYNECNCILSPLSSVRFASRSVSVCGGAPAQGHCACPHRSTLARSPLRHAPRSHHGAKRWLQLVCSAAASYRLTAFFSGPHRQARSTATGGLIELRPALA